MTKRYWTTDDDGTPARWEEPDGDSSPSKKFLASSVVTETLLDPGVAALAFDFPADGSAGSDITLSADGTTFTFVTSGMYSVLGMFNLAGAATPDGTVRISIVPTIDHGDPLYTDGPSVTPEFPIAGAGEMWIPVVIPTMWFTAGGTFQIAAARFNSSTGTVNVETDSFVVVSKVA